MTTSSAGAADGAPPRPVTHTRRAFLGMSAAAGALTWSLTATPASASAEPVGARSAGEGPPRPFAWTPGPPSAGSAWARLLAFDPSTEPDLWWGASVVPLATRVATTPGHRGQRVGEMRVQALVAPGSTRRLPGDPEAAGLPYAFTHWALLDELVVWSGSPAAALVLPPPAALVDAAHRAGVPVLGSVVLPGVADGGLPQWTLDLCEEADGVYPVADVLALVAQSLGFDGWFVSTRTDLGLPASARADVAARMRGFLRSLTSLGLRTTWEDSLDTRGAVAPAGRLTSTNEAFLQDGAARTSTGIRVRGGLGARPGALAADAERAASIGRSPFEVWHGVDTTEDGVDTAVAWRSLVPSAEAPARGSLGLQGTEWSRDSLPAGSTLEQFHERDHAYWIGGDAPQVDDGSGWPGVAAFVTERTTVRTLPFTTTFGTGAGRGYWIEGEQVDTRPWHDLGLQDTHPTRRWVTDAAGRSLAPRWDFDLAYEGGDSLALDLSAGLGELLLLLLDDVEAPADDEVRVIARTATGRGRVASLAFVVGTVDGGTVDLPARPTPVGRSGWTAYTAPLRRVGGRLRSLGLRVAGSGTLHLGRLDVGLAGREAPATVHDVCAHRSGDGVRVHWAATEAVRHVEVHADGHFVGATAGRALHLHLPARTLEVVAVSRHHVRAAPVRVTPSARPTRD